MASMRAIAAASLLDSSRTARGVSLRFGAEAGPELRRLIAAESECCPFLEFDLRPQGSHLRLEVEGPDAARPIIDELFSDSERNSSSGAAAG
jgi:hypothetical protein